MLIDRQTLARVTCHVCQRGETDAAAWLVFIYLFSYADLLFRHYAEQSRWEEVFGEEKEIKIFDKESMKLILFSSNVASKV
jgi:hypothetical protein